jgi:hypothetical protein
MLPNPSCFQASSSLEEAPEDAEGDDREELLLSLRPPSCLWRVSNANKRLRAFFRSLSKTCFLASSSATILSNSFLSKYKFVEAIL